MDSFEPYQSPLVKQEPLWGRGDTMDRRPSNDQFRRRSPGKRSAIEYQIQPVLLRNASLYPSSPIIEQRSEGSSASSSNTPSSAATSSSTSSFSPIIPKLNDTMTAHIPFQIGIPDRRVGPRGGRGRSRSPTTIDRYQPGHRNRDDYFDSPRDHPSRSRDDRRRPPSPPLIDRYIPGQTPQPAVRQNPVQDPLTIEYQVGFTYFAEWWRYDQLVKEDKERVKTGGRPPPDRGIKGERESREDREKERAQIQAGYDAYKLEFQIKMGRLFVQQHKDEEWFRERYLPEFRELFKQRLTAFRRAALGQWEKDIDSGSFDEFTLEGIYKTESNGMGGVVEREEGETVAAAEVLGVGDLVPSRGGDIRDESALQPALLIKTLAPMVSRGKIEGFCREHLGEEDGGFKWLSLSDPNPGKKYHRIGWIMLHPAAEEPSGTEREDGRGEDEDEGMEVESKPTVSTADKALEAINGKTIEDETRGNFTCHVGVHVPPREPRKKALWDLFSAPERVDRDLELAKRLVAKFDQDFGTDANGVAKVEQRVEDIRSRGLLQSSVGASSDQKKEEAADDIDEDGMEDDDEGEEDGLIDEENDSEELLIKKKTLDLLVEYLRRVYNFCFFCVFESDSIHELIRKCPGGHLRRPRASLSSSAKRAAKASALGEPFPLKRKDIAEDGEETKEASSPVAERFAGKPNFKSDQQLLRAFNWVKTFEEKVLQILEPENVDVKKLGGKPIDEALDEELKKFVKQEDENKFRCKVPECTKLFKGEVFWRKHVEKRHGEWFEEIKKNLTLVNTYVLDPSHIAPSRSDANSNGHFPNNQHNNPAGTPRGFNLQNMPSMMGFPPNFTPGSGPGGQFPGFQPNFGPHAVQPPAWNMNNPSIPNGVDESHQAGPMRRGGGRFRSSIRSTGPYDRRQQPRYSNGIGGPGPMMMGNGGPMGMGMNRRVGGFGMGGGKWGDGAGAQTVGPKEAVQGRVLKKYDDLDAVDGAGGGELNY